MRYRRIPRTNIQCSAVGVPVSELLLAGPRRLDPAGAQRLLHRALDLGITLFDVTDFPGEGESERLLAGALGKRRPAVVITARGGYDWYKPAHLRPEGRITQEWSAAFIRKACDSSLLRLRTDYIDLYQLHFPGMAALEREELFLDTLPTLKKEGKVREFGVVLGPGTAWDEEGEMAVKERKAPAVQAVYNILQQKPVRSLFPLAKDMQTGVLAADPLASGLLDRFPGTEAAVNPRLRELDFLAQHYEATLTQAAVQFVLASPEVVAALPKVAREDRLAEIAAAPDLPPLDEADLQQLRDLYDAGFGVKGRA